MNTTISCERGCGFRSEGGTYLCLGIGPGGTLTIEDLILDPVKIWPGDWQRGFKILSNRGGWNDVGIFISKEDYPSIWDFSEECWRYGISRKVPPTFPFEQLTPGLSRMVFIHARAYPKFDYSIDDFDVGPLHGCKFFPEPEYKELWETTFTGWHPQVEKKTPCTFAHRHLAGLIHDEAPYGENLEFEIKRPSFSYKGIMPVIPAPAGTQIKLEWQIGAFMSAPLSHVEMPKKLNKNAAQRANKSGFETIVTDW